MCGLGQRIMEKSLSEELEETLQGTEAVESAVPGSVGKSQRDSGDVGLCREQLWVSTPIQGSLL